MAYKKRKTFKKRTTFKRRASKAPRMPTASNKKIRDVCLKVIAQRTENKVMNYLFARTNMFVYGNAFWGGAQCFPISPYSGYVNTVQGSGQNQRLGNEISIKKATIKLMFNQNAYSATTNNQPAPMLIKVVTFYDKTQTTLLPTLVPGLYQNGSSTLDPDANGLNVDIIKTFNRDRYVIKSSRVLKVGWSTNVNAASGAQSLLQYHANNDFPMFNTFSLDYTKYLVKTVKYNDTTVTPTTRGLFMALFLMSADGNSISAVNTTCNYQGFINIEYEDA